MIQFIGTVCLGVGKEKKNRQLGILYGRERGKISPFVILSPFARWHVVHHLCCEPATYVSVFYVGK